MPYIEINHNKGFNFSKYPEHEAKENTMKYLFNALLETNIDKDKNDLLLCDIRNNINDNESELKELRQEIKAQNKIIELLKKLI